MTGITSIGAYIPMYRLAREHIGAMWRLKGMAGEKAVAGYDEDSVTMAVAAGLDCMRRDGSAVEALYFATTTAPYREKQSAGVIASALDLDRRCHTAELGSSLRAGTGALRAALDAVASGSASRTLVLASDCRTGAPRGRLEQLLGDGAAALMIGSQDPLATVEGSYSIFSDFTDVWRRQDDAFPRSAEARLVVDAGYVPLMTEAVTGLMKKYGLTPGDFSKVVFSALEGKEHADLAKGLGFDKSQVEDHLFGRIGHTGAAAPLIMLVAALEAAKPGDTILFASYGDGVDAFVLRVTDRAGRMGAPTMEDRLARKTPIDYGAYLYWRDLVPLEASSLPDRPEPSLAARWREHGAVSALYGSRCAKCGTPQIHPLGQTARICVACQSKDHFEPYRFSDKPGRLFTYAVDQLQPTRNPPGLNGVVDFEGGGRLACELTDCDPGSVAVGMPVEMTFRRLSRGREIVNYFWKARPVSQAGAGKA